MRHPVLGALCGIAAAVLFGVSAPLAKLLLPHVDAWMLAGLLYLGAGAGLVAFRLMQRATGARSPAQHERLRRADVPTLLVIACVGGGLGPVLLLIGLRHVSGVAGALLLNLEAVFTALLAVTMFGEQVNRRETIAITIVIVGASLVSLAGGPIRAEVLGAGAIVAACAAWAIDNNLTARLSARNAVDLVRFKALTAGAGNLLLATATGHSMPAPSIIVLSLCVGLVSYGVSIVLDVYALRYVGAARESAYFATAPFAGAIAAVPLLREPVGRTDIIGGLVMAAGIALLLAARRSAE